MNMEKVNEEAKKFWEEKEKIYGEPVKFYTFATFLGRSGGESVHLGGLIYIINKNLCFEDFERDNWFSKLITKDKKYEKTEFSIELDSIEKIQLVTKSSSIKCILGYIKDNETKIVKGFGRFILQPVTQIKLRDGNSYFFETMRQKELLDALKF